MVPTDFLIHKSRMSLGEFLAPMIAQLDKPHKRFLQQVLRGILFSGSLVVMVLCRWVRNGSTDTLVTGYWCIKVYTCLPHKRLLSLVMEVYGIDDPAVGNGNLQI